MPEHHRYELPVRPDEVELRTAQLWAAGALGVWQRPGTLAAWFHGATAPVPDGGTWALEPDRDWQAEWKATIGPVHAGRITIVPSWLADDHAARDDQLTLVLDPGRAFGSGHHATTTLCLELLDELDLDGRTLVDVGCGTGILAIAAAARGAQVLAVDIDPEAVEVTAINAADNGVEVETRVGSIDVVDGPVDVVVANLVTDVVVALAPQLVTATRRHLVASGITAERQERALAALRDAGLRIDEVRERDGWVVVHGSPTLAEGAGGEVAAGTATARG
jgi:ribosomal protein L11 methyltransferase